MSSADSYIGPAYQAVASVDREALRKAVISALPVDWDDYTTLVKVIPAADESGHPWNIWGHPEQVADAVIAALQQYLPPVRVKEVDSDA